MNEIVRLVFQTAYNTKSIKKRTMSRYIPADVRRELRKEANFGCAICGIPIIEYHHIIPYSEQEHHDPDHMIALCPTHHRPSDDAAITRKELYDLKKESA